MSRQVPRVGGKAQSDGGCRLLFASYHGYTDPSSGAAIATRDLLELVAARGWDARVFCGPALDFESPESLRQLLSDQQIPYRERRSSKGPIPFSVVHFRQNGVPVGVYLPDQGTSAAPSQPEGTAFLTLLERVLEEFGPEILLTYGGDWVAAEIMRRARRRGIQVVFALHNFNYRAAELFRGADAVLVPSEFCADWYRQRLGLRCRAIPSPLNWSRLRCQRSGGRQYVTFVNPQPTKGVYVFAGIVRELARRRRDIPVLVVEGRGGVDWLGCTGVDLGSTDQLYRMANTPDPRDFYSVSRVLLMPSLWNESFGRVAAESLLNGIPVLGSRRGALPEVLREGGFLLDIPDRYTPETRTVPTPEEVAPWVETIVRLWDDAAWYGEQSRRCVAAAERWRPEPLAEEHARFFGSLLSVSLVGSGAGL